MRRPEFIARQGGAPHGLLGRIIARIMSVETAAENRATLDLLDLQPTDRVLEVGSGHGRTLWQLAEQVPQGLAAGVDVSEDMVRMARRRPWFGRKPEHIEVHLTNGIELPFADDAFDKAFSVHTLYFWDQPEATLREIARVIAPGGMFVLAFRTKEDPAAALFPESVYRFYSREDVQALLKAAGFERDQERSLDPSASGLVLLRVRKSSHPTEKIGPTG